MKPAIHTLLIPCQVKKAHSADLFPSDTFSLNQCNPVDNILDLVCFQSFFLFGGRMVCFVLFSERLNLSFSYSFPKCCFLNTRSVLILVFFAHLAYRPSLSQMVTCCFHGQA